MIRINEGSYRGQHKAPSANGGAPLHDMTVLYPDDIYSNKAAQYYGHYGGRHPIDVKAIKIIHSYQGQPNKKITIYRAVPAGASLVINKGDWVTIVKDYAVEHGESHLRGNYEIASKNVRAKDIFSDANSIHEFGYDPQ